MSNLRELLGSRYSVTMPWLTHCAMTSLQHGWALAVAMMSPADADRVLSELKAHGFITRGKQDLTYAKEITAFGVGGTTGRWLREAQYPCLYCWSPTTKLVESVTSETRLG